MTTRKFLFRFTRRRVILLVFLLVLLVGSFLAYCSSPMTQLSEARALWQSQNITAYRIAVQYQIPLYECQQDFDVRDEQVAYRYKDECQVTPVAGSFTGQFEPLIVSDLFQRIEDTFTNPDCGPNGCACDGPIGVDVVYDSKYGFPQKLTYRIVPELRWRYLDYWRALLSGASACPAPNPKTTLSTPTASTPLQTITVISFKPLKPETTGIGSLPLPTPELTP